MSETKETRHRTLNRLSAIKVDTAGSGIHADGGGLILRVDDKGGRKWLLRFTSPVTGKRRDMGLGRAGKGFTTLAAARTAAADARELVARGLDPMDEAEREKRERLAEARKSAPKTFGEFADDWLALRASGKDGFRNEKHHKQWVATLNGTEQHPYASSLRAKLPSEITTADVTSVLDPLWKSTPETARRVQNRIEQVLDAARVEGVYSGPNPARWRRHLADRYKGYGKRLRGHHAAMDHADLPAFVMVLREKAGIAARALDFLILTAARSGEVRGMSWGELDPDRTRWTVPGTRMKAGREHRVPLTNRAREILTEMERFRRNVDDPAELVFPGQGREENGAAKAMSDMTLAAVLKRMERSAITVHGFRSTFRDWAGDRTNFARDIVEQALAHRVGDATEQAYRRGDAFERRAKLMAAWEAYALSGSVAGNIVNMQRARSG